MSKRLHLTLLSFIILLSTAQAQDHFLASGSRTPDDLYKDYKFPEAIEAYKSQLDKGKNERHAIQRIADSYRRTGQYAASEEWYAKLVQFQDIDPENYFYYAKALSTNKKYDQAAEWFKRYAQLKGNDSKSKNNKSFSVEQINRLLQNNSHYTISPLSINSENDEFSPFVQDNKIYFVSNRPDENKSKSTYSWDEQSYLDLYEGTAYAGRVSDVTAIRSLNTPYHEGPITISKDGRRMYLTTNTMNEKNKLIKDSKNTTHLQISASNKLTIDGETTWSKPIPLSFNGTNYSCVHPTLSPDGKYMVFASDMPGGFGGMDLYICENLMISWSNPINLGPEINTSGDEVFPFYASNGSLYFSSDGHLGLGGLDILVAKARTEKNKFGRPENMGAPINDVTDDFAITLNEDGKTGYFSSNRPGGKGRDDIYYLETTTPEIEVLPVLPKQLEVRVFEEATNIGLPAAVVNVFDERGKLVTALQVNDSGYFKTGFDQSKYAGNLRFIASYGNYATQREIVDMGELFKEDRSLVSIPLYRDLGKELRINPIYFDYNKSNIRPDAAAELDKIVNIMRDNGDLVIEVGSHTDSRGTAEYNQALSDRRAKSSVLYITENGIETYRVYGKGYGESQLVNQCEDGVKCTDPEHQKNRRTEFKVVRGSLRR